MQLRFDPRSYECCLDVLTAEPLEPCHSLAESLCRLSLCGTEHLPGLSGVVLTFLLQPRYYPSWISVLFSSNNNCEYCHKGIIIPSYIGSPQTHVVLDSKFKAKIMLIPNFVGCLGLYSNHTHSCTQMHPLLHTNAPTLAHKCTHSCTQMHPLLHTNAPTPETGTSHGTVKPRGSVHCGGIPQDIQG